ncbi:hypothetical protein BHM03_00004586 [Ensete ventricosum]|nr:hypothetical protein BHM03_00004586 [Ensete ventricosum]
MGLSLIHGLAKAHLSRGWLIHFPVTCRQERTIAGVLFVWAGVCRTSGWRSLVSGDWGLMLLVVERMVFPEIVVGRGLKGRFLVARFMEGEAPISYLLLWILTQQTDFGGFTKFSRNDHVKWKSEGRIIPDGVDAKVSATAVLMFRGSVDQSTAVSTMRGSDLQSLLHKQDVCPEYSREEVLGVDLQFSSDLS